MPTGINLWNIHLISHTPLFCESAICVVSNVCSWPPQWCRDSSLIQTVSFVDISPVVIWGHKRGEPLIVHTFPSTQPPVCTIAQVSYHPCIANLPPKRWFLRTGFILILHNMGGPWSHWEGGLLVRVNYSTSMCHLKHVVFKAGLNVCDRTSTSNPQQPQHMRVY